MPDLNTKEGFILYTGLYNSVREFLSLEQRGMLMDAIHDYQESDTEPPKDSPIAMAFAFYKNQFRLDGKKQDRRAEMARMNGSRGGRPKEKTEKTQSVISVSEKTQSVILQTQESYKEKDKVKVKVKEKDKAKDQSLPPTPLEIPLKEVVFVEHPTKQPQPKANEDEDGSQYIEEINKLRKAMAKFIQFYGKEGNPSSVEQELRTASSEVMKRKNMTYVESLTFLLHKADDCRKYETDIEPTELKFRKKPENWLSNNCWENQYGQDWENGKRVDLTPAPKSQIELEVEERARIRRMDERLQAEWEQEQAAIERGKSK